MSDKEKYQPEPKQLADALRELADDIEKCEVYECEINGHQDSIINPISEGINAHRGYIRTGHISLNIQMEVYDPSIDERKQEDDESK